MAYQPLDSARRRLRLKAAVFGDSAGAAYGAPQMPACVAIGTILDASPHVLIAGTSEGREERFLLMQSTWAWRGRQTRPETLRRGQHVIIRHRGRGHVADRIWADIGRATGTIVERTGNTLLIDQGHSRGRSVLMLTARSSKRIFVRFPKLEPGYLVDVIGLRRGGVVEGLVPATSQPPYHSDHVPRTALVRGRVPQTISGSACWHEPAEEPDTLRGVSYPALDPDSGCGGDTGPCDRAVSCARLPYLSIGSMLLVSNDCSGQRGPVPVTGCGSSASRFCDRCLACGISPRGRIADLTMASFVELGGELHTGCFNATIGMGGPR
jgi:hypothetical protein